MTEEDTLVFLQNEEGIFHSGSQGESRESKEDKKEIFTFLKKNGEK